MELTEYLKTNRMIFLLNVSVKYVLKFDFQMAYKKV